MLCGLIHVASLAVKLKAVGLLTVFTGYSRPTVVGLSFVAILRTNLI